MNKKYPIDQSPYYCLRSKERLAEILWVKSVTTLIELTGDNFYYEIDKKGKVFTPPIKGLRRVHDRVQSLLSRIKTPEYLHSGVKGRSNLTNALEHSYKSGLVKTDIQSFFPSITNIKIGNFFKGVMRCSPNVAKLLANMLTFNGVVPKGSPCSTTIAFWANKNMFDEIERICIESNATFTVYVDDISISMTGLNRNMLRRVNGIIRRNGYSHHKHRIYKPTQSKVITGIVPGPQKAKVTKGIYLKSIGDKDSATSVGRAAYIKYVTGYRK